MITKISLFQYWIFILVQAIWNRPKREQEITVMCFGQVKPEKNSLKISKHLTRSLKLYHNSQKTSNQKKKKTYIYTSLTLVYRIFSTRTNYLWKGILIKLFPKKIRGTYFQHGHGPMVHTIELSLWATVRNNRNIIVDRDIRDSLRDIMACLFAL